MGDQGLQEVSGLAGGGCPGSLFIHSIGIGGKKIDPQLPAITRGNPQLPAVGGLRAPIGEAHRRGDAAGKVFARRKGKEGVKPSQIGPRA
jgi:hypothetical protein